MARPKQGYRNAAGEVIPGCTDITGRYMDRSRLLYWAFGRGKEGAKHLYDDALAVGTVVHQMAELAMRDQPMERIAFYTRTSLPDPEDQQKAASAFAAFQAWRKEFHVDPYALEVSCVSERYQYGGTIDTVAVIRGGLGIVDYKTSKAGEVYEDMVLQLAGYALLWEETHPVEPITEGYHLIVLPKDGGKPVHREWSWEQLERFAQKFALYRRAYAIDTSSAAALKGTKVAPSTKPAEKPRVRVKVVRAEEPAAPPTLSMAEILRMHGHVRAVA